MSLLNQLVPEVKPNGVKRPSKRQTYGDCFVDVIPYNANFDKQAEKFLPWMWSKLKADGLVSLYFPGADETGFADFVKMFSGNVCVLIVVLKDKEGAIVEDGLIGFATLEFSRMGHTPMGHAGFIFLKDWWDRKTSDEAVERMVHYWFNDLPTKLDIIVGIIAETNTLALKFTKRVGWTYAGTLPMLHQYKGERCGATLWYITRPEPA